MPRHLMRTRAEYFSRCFAFLNPGHILISFFSADCLGYVSLIAALDSRSCLFFWPR